ncbi:MAG: hypothetical protein BJ554DRAFT_1052, partial [Olpidium bornovanus]
SALAIRRVADPSGKPAAHAAALKLNAGPPGDTAELERRLPTEKDDLIVMNWRKKEFTRMYALRSDQPIKYYFCFRPTGLLEILDDDLKFLWITDFPLFSRVTNEDPKISDRRQLTSTHHPFTASRDEDVARLFTDPESVSQFAVSHLPVF